MEYHIHFSQLLCRCHKKNIFLVEDASHAHGSKYKNRPAGSFGIGSAFSMFATKVITTSEGGIIVSNNGKIKDLSRIYRDQGKDKEGIKNIIFGSAWRMSELHAALGIVQMRNIDKYLERNNTIVKLYKTNLQTNKLTVPYDNDSFYSGYKFIVLLKSESERDSLKSFLYDNGIKVGKNVYDIPLQFQPALKITTKDNYPLSEHFAKTHICLPIWKGMKISEAKKVIKVVNNWSNSNR